ncbi:MAG: MtnX-like HAD-IB family phosphatase [candidate division Zixibacteria bacterium]
MKNAKINKITVFSDFDGTISTRDVGNRLFHHFSEGKSEEAVRHWKLNEIDSRECLLQEAAAMRKITETELFEFIDSFEIDPTFIDFVEYMRHKEMPLYLLSDGLDIYIYRLLQKYKLDGLEVFANSARLINGRLKFTFPYYDKSCGGCANCKGYHIRNLRQQYSRAVYIGDGRSDVCALDEADIIFAKDYLAEYCREHKIEFLPFNNFSVITEVLAEKIGR